MKQHIYYSIIVLLTGVLFVLSKPSQAQTNEQAPVYVQVGFMKVPAGSGAEYVNMERELWKPVHEELIKQGIISAWHLFAVRHGDASYNFVTVNVYNDFAKMEDPYPEGIFQKVHGEVNMDEVATRTFNSREMVRSEVSVLADGVMSGNSGEPKYVVVNFMDVTGSMAEYLRVEREIWKPVHKVLQSQGITAGWEVYTLLFPAGTSQGYNAVTVDVFSEYGDIGNPLTMEHIQAAHRGAGEDEINNMVEKTSAARNIYKRELWELIDSAVAVTE